MAKQKVVFGPAAAKRIVAVTKRVEATPISHIGRRRGLPLPGVESHLLIRNDSVNELLRGYVIGINDIPTGAVPPNFPIVLQGGTPPDYTQHRNNFAIALQTIAASGGVGRCVISGEAWVKVDFAAGANHRFADIKDGYMAELEATGIGNAQILYNSESSGTPTGINWALVKLGISPEYVPVDCTQTGGSAGNTTTPCSFTYTISDRITGAQIATNVGMDGIGHRIVNAVWYAGTKGQAFRLADGTWKLARVDETLNGHVC